MKNKRFRKVVKYDLEGFYKRWRFEYETIKNPSFLDILLFPFILLLVSTIAIIFYPYYLFLNIKEYRQVFFEEQK